MAELFHGPKLKIERAKKHISDLQARFLDFASTNYYRLDFEKDPGTGNNLLRFTITESLPEDTALIIGDAFHNLRSALDFAISDVLFMKTGTRPKHAKFPVYKSRDDLVNAVSGGKISEAPKEILDFIVDIVKPYEGGNEAIRALHELDILDKHMLLLPIVQIGALTGVDLEDDRGNQFRKCDFIVEAGTAFIPIASSGNIKITDFGKPTIFVMFDKRMPLEGPHVLPTLAKLTRDIGYIVDEFERISKL
jgi:hypothetical protein